MNKKILKWVSVFVIVFSLLTLTSCRNKKKWFNYSCEWNCSEYNFHLGKQGNHAKLTYNEEEYSFDTAKSNNASYIRFYIDDKQVMHANTTYKNDILYLEFTQDDIADFEGKTLTFTKVIAE